MGLGAVLWLKQAISSSEIFPSTLNDFREDRVTDTVGGGVFQAVKDDLICTHLQDLNTDCGHKSHIGQKKCFTPKYSEKCTYFVLTEHTLYYEHRTHIKVYIF